MLELVFGVLRWGIDNDHDVTKLIGMDSRNVLISTVLLSGKLGPFCSLSSLSRLFVSIVAM